MGREDRRVRRDKGEGGERRRGRKGEAEEQLNLVNNLVEEVRTIDSEIDLLKQKMNLIIREINVLKRAILQEKQQIKELEIEEGKDKSRFEGMLNLIRSIRGGG
jgi:hypothetical protein